MGWDTCYKAISTKFATLATAQGVTDIYDNDGTDTFPDNATWVYVSIIPGETKPISYDTKRTSGEMVAVITVVKGRGDAAATALADAIVTAFQHTTTSGVRYLTPYLFRRSDTQYAVHVPFEYDESY